MTRFDSRGLPLSTMSDSAAERYRPGIDALLSASPGAAETREEAITADPDFALAHAARAQLHAIRAEPAKAPARIAKAEDIVGRHGTERERSHVEIRALTIIGQSANALERALAHTGIWPRDVLILLLPLGAFGLFAFSGMADHDQARVDFCERHARDFGADAWWFLTYRGYELRTKNTNAAHALSHAPYEGGAGREAEKLIADWLPGYDRTGTLHGHIAWHVALGALGRGDPERALQAYAPDIQPSVTAGMPVNVVGDAASFLWRLQAYGHTMPEGLWEAAAAYVGEYFQNAGFAFADVQMVLIAAVERRVEALSGLIEAGALAGGRVVPAICRAALAFAGEDYEGCARLLERVAVEVVRIGGSGAQREMIEVMLLLALMRSCEAVRARALLDHRLHRRPSPRDTRGHILLAA